MKKTKLDKLCERIARRVVELLRNDHEEACDCGLCGDTQGRVSTYVTGPPRPIALESDEERQRLLAARIAREEAGLCRAYDHVTASGVSSAVGASAHVVNLSAKETPQ